MANLPFTRSVNRLKANVCGDEGQGALKGRVGVTHIPPNIVNN